MKILLLEDNVQLAESLGEYLEGVGCELDYAYNAKSCVKLVEQNQYDALVLDISMPGMTGLQACEEIRQRLQVATPLLFLTARDSLEDKLIGFNTGCDDYLVKPFAPEELHCRLKALEARGPRRDIGMQTFGVLTINHVHQSVEREGITIQLHATQFNLLKQLIKASPNVVSRETLEHAVWGDDLPESDALRTHMYRLRNTLDRPFKTPLITTVHGKGYRLETH
ncbi:response regulator transcription factor [Aliiglaciecola sp. LCG003]|uniref:response regulator transcription factor n=1 Tax=Aliiglaciecola sp. LCG003 TaxID=3053655 RepID=UPI002572B80F|nr:response regulator transcription factor [Aliiglaciecola sp. LCG003]WJG09905.1 response regulator transcription factor [Aliiglaciecola sp. LCG003]